MSAHPFLLLTLFLLLISGCTYPISKELRQEASKELTFTVVQQNPTAYTGSIVIWGGKIIDTRNIAGGSEIIVLETPLDYQDLPEPEKYSQGRFIAKTSKFLDPDVYKKGRMITVAGEITGKETKALGKTEYTYPVVIIKQIHLLKKYTAYYSYPPGYYYGYDGPHYGPFSWYNQYGPWGWSDYYDYDYYFEGED